MKIMCTFCHNSSNDNLTQWRKGEAGMLTQGPDSKFAPFLPGHVAKKLQHSASSWWISVFPCLIYVYISPRSKPKSKRNQD